MWYRIYGSGVGLHGDGKLEQFRLSKPAAKSMACTGSGVLYLCILAQRSIIPHHFRYCLKVCYRQWVRVPSLTLACLSFWYTTTFKSTPLRSQSSGGGASKLGGQPLNFTTISLLTNAWWLDLWNKASTRRDRRFIRIWRLHISLGGGRAVGSRGMHVVCWSGKSAETPRLYFSLGG